MNEPVHQLDRLQRWMQSVITHPEGVSAGIESETAREQFDIDVDEIETVISRSKALNSIERLHVYGNAYYARLIECMAGEFPATQTALGEEAFGGFVMGYLQVSPSTSYTLGDLGRKFPDYLAESRPPREIQGPDWADFLIELATLELAYSEVFDGPGEEQMELLRADDLLAISPDKWGDSRLRTAASLRLLRFQFPVQEYAAAVRQGNEAIVPQPYDTWLAINRRDYIVRRRPLPELAFVILEQLQQGAPLTDAIETAVADHNVDMTGFADRLREWFGSWTRDGYFVDVEID
ncbi:MAG: putative DNA-binding domain-containing protein [Planctomycetaceae bacterium]|nr:putative DNA-binding domain-containing protein [Planctomycetaceae bacterium]